MRRRAADEEFYKLLFRVADLKVLAFPTGRKSARTRVASGTNAVLLDSARSPNRLGPAPGRGSQLCPLRKETMRAQFQPGRGSKARLDERQPIG